MTTLEIERNAIRGEIMQYLYSIDDENTLKRFLRSARRAFKAQQVSEEETEYISKQELMDGIREGLNEMFRAQRTGEKLKDAEELFNEL